MTVFRYTSERFLATSNRASNDSSGTSILRGINLFIRGRNGNSYAEVYGGSLSLSETIPTEAITGTVTFSTTSKVVVGVGTSFTTELHLGQRLETLAGELVVVADITDDTHFSVFAYPLANAAAQTLYRLPILFEMDRKRGTLLSGNAMEFDRGNIMCVGSGTLRVNGATLTASLVASKAAKMAIRNETTGNYLIQTLGFTDVPYGITVTAAAAPAADTFTEANVDTATNVITSTAHGWQTGQEVTLTQAGTLPAPLAKNTPYFIIRTSADAFKLATSLSNAMAGTAIDLTTVGTANTNTVTPISKNMPAGARSLRIAKASTKLGTPSFGNPGEKLKVTLTVGQSIAISFPAMDSSTDANDPHDAWRVYGSSFGGTEEIATANADSGPWYHVRTITSAELGGTAAATYYLEYLDAEIDGTLRLITFDNDAPQDAEMIATVAGYPVLVSCQGKATVAEPQGTSPGPSIVPFKTANLAAAPLVLDNGQRNEVPLSPPEYVIGCYEATGRLYLMTANTLQIAAFTSDPDFPVSTRPFWKSGFRNPYALCFANDRLYGFTNAPIRSPEEGSDSDIDRGFAADVMELMKDWQAENVMVVYDPQNECVCYVHTGGVKNAQGFWITEIIPFVLSGDEHWSHKIVLTSTTQDRIVTGVATVSGHFEFLMGGRNGAGAMDIKTYRFDTVSGETVAYSQAWAYSDAGSEDRPKTIKSPRVTGKVTSATIGIFGAAAGENIEIDNLTVSATSSKSGAIALDTGSGVEYRARENCVVRGIMNFTPAIFGTWAGTGAKDRIDECTIDVIVQGRRM